LEGRDNALARDASRKNQNVNRPDLLSSKPATRR